MCWLCFQRCLTLLNPLLSISPSIKPFVLAKDFENLSRAHQMTLSHSFVVNKAFGKKIGETQEYNHRSCQQAAQGTPSRSTSNQTHAGLKVNLVLVRKHARHRQIFDSSFCRPRQYKALWNWVLGGGWSWCKRVAKLATLTKSSFWRDKWHWALHVALAFLTEMMWSGESVEWTLKNWQKKFHAVFYVKLQKGIKKKWRVK